MKDFVKNAEIINPPNQQQRIFEMRKRYKSVQAMVDDISGPDFRKKFKKANQHAIKMVAARDAVIKATNDWRISLTKPFVKKDPGTMAMLLIHAIDKLNKLEKK